VTEYVPARRRRSPRDCVRRGCGMRPGCPRRSAPPAWPSGTARPGRRPPVRNTQLTWGMGSRPCTGRTPPAGPRRTSRIGEPWSCWHPRELAMGLSWWTSWASSTWSTGRSRVPRASGRTCSATSGRSSLIATRVSPAPWPRRPDSATPSRNCLSPSAGTRPSGWGTPSFIASPAPSDWRPR
jgi:hypothetical protein